MFYLDTESIRKFIPTTRLKNANTSQWIDAEIIALSRKKETVREKALCTDSPNDWATYCRLRNRLRTSINHKYNQYIANSFNHINSNPK